MNSCSVWTLLRMTLYLIEALYLFTLTSLLNPVSSSYFGIALFSMYPPTSWRHIPWLHLQHTSWDRCSSDSTSALNPRHDPQRSRPNPSQWGGQRSHPGAPPRDGRTSPPGGDHTSRPSSWPIKTSSSSSVMQSWDVMWPGMRSTLYRSKRCPNWEPTQGYPGTSCQREPKSGYGSLE